MGIETKLYFEEINVGLSGHHTPFRVTKFMYLAHVIFHSFDWSGPELETLLQKGVVPSPLVYAHIAGQRFKEGPFRIYVGKNLDNQVLMEPIHINDKVYCAWDVLDTDPISTESKSGKVVMKEMVYIQSGPQPSESDRLAYTRDLTLYVTKKSSGIPYQAVSFAKALLMLLNYKGNST